MEDVNRITDRDDPYFGTITRFLHRDDPDSRLYPRTQDDEGGCYAFVYVVLMYEAIWRTFGRKVRLSEQQIIDQFSLFEPDKDRRVHTQPKHPDITEYIRTHGLLMNFCYPRARVLKEFRMPRMSPRLPVNLYHASFTYIWKDDFVSHLDAGSSIGVQFYWTAPYTDWIKAGAIGVFPGVYPTIDHPHLVIGRADLVTSHVVVVVGYGYCEDGLYFVTQDSTGTHLNCGYRKVLHSWISPSGFIADGARIANLIGAGI